MGIHWVLRISEDFSVFGGKGRDVSGVEEETLDKEQIVKVLEFHAKLFVMIGSHI